MAWGFSIINPNISICPYSPWKLGEKRCPPLHSEQHSYQRHTTCLAGAYCTSVALSPEELPHASGEAEGPYPSYGAGAGWDSEGGDLSPNHWDDIPHEENEFVRWLLLTACRAGGMFGNGTWCGTRWQNAQIISTCHKASSLNEQRRLLLP